MRNVRVQLMSILWRAQLRAILKTEEERKSRKLLSGWGRVSTRAENLPPVRSRGGWGHGGLQ